MTATERGVCPDCGRRMALRQDGTLRDHNPRPLTPDQWADSAWTAGPSAKRARRGGCSGAGRKPVTT